jgi:DNA-binding transcriptional LysR family regulator
MRLGHNEVIVWFDDGITKSWVLPMPWDERLGRRLKLRDLHVLKTAAQLGSLGKAATRLAVSQPAVSKAIVDLERLLGVRLLDRTPQGVEPTCYGAALLKWSALAFDDLKRGVEEIDFLADPTAGHVRIGTGEGMPAGLIAAVTDRLMRQYPRLTFTVRQAATNDLQYRDLRERNVDLIFGRLTTPTTDEDLNTEVLFEDPSFPVGSVKSKWIKRRKINLAELVNEPWCLPDDSLLLSAMTNAFRAKGLDMPRCVMSTNSIQLHYELAATGQVLAMATGLRLRLIGKRMGLKALPVDFLVLNYPTGVVTLKNRSGSPLAQVFIECARRVVGGK